MKNIASISKTFVSNQAHPFISFSTNCLKDARTPFKTYRWVELVDCCFSEIYIYIYSEVKLAQISHSLPLKALAHLPTWFSSPAERQALLIPPETETPCDTSNFIPAFWPVYPGWSWSILPSLYLSVPTMFGEQAVTYCLESRKQMENKDNEGAPGAKLQTGKEG